MGMCKHVLDFLVYCNEYGNFKDTVTLGRQNVHYDTTNHPKIKGSYKFPDFCEQMLIDSFGSTFVDSIDYSSFEGASIIFDLSKPIIEEHLIEKYDTILDLGTLEHVFHINNALINASKLCKINGQIIHVLPANQECGHGFWQFSPELFFSLYSKENGYSDTEVFVSDFGDENSTLQKLTPPNKFDRLMITSYSSTYIMVRTKKIKHDFSHEHVYQSDYVSQWDNHQ